MARTLALLATVAASLTVASAGTPKHPGDADLVLPATIDHVIDGDSIAVVLASGPMEVRLHGADAPEWKQPFGREATAKLKRTLRKGEAVELLPIEQDRYERMVAVVYLAGKSVNEMLIREGFAWAYRDYLGQLPEDARYCELEAEARAGHRGLWSQAPQLWVPPWIYRRRERAALGAEVPARDYTQETAAQCVGAMRRARIS